MGIGTRLVSAALIAAVVGTASWVYADTQPAGAGGAAIHWVALDDHGDGGDQVSAVSSGPSSGSAEASQQPES